MIHAVLAFALLAISALAKAAPNAPVNNVNTGAGAPMTINTPTSVLECQPVQFTWIGGLAPYYLALIPGDQPFSPPLRRFPTQNSTSFTWNADLPAGTKFNLLLRDSTGAQAYSATVMEQEGNDKSCEKPITVVPQPGATALSPAVTGAAQPLNAAVDGTTNITSSLNGHLTTTASGTAPSSSTSQTATHMSASAARYHLRGIELWWVFGMGAVGVLML